MSTSKTVRAEAVLLLNALASRRTAADYIALGFFGMANELGVSNEAVSLARDCFDAIPSMTGCIAHLKPVTDPDAFELECCQAALLVEEGWEHGDSIEGHDDFDASYHLAGDLVDSSADEWADN